MRSNSAAAREWRDNGTIVIATFVGISFLSLTTNSLNMFIEPVSAEFGWSRAFISLGYSISAFVTALLAPFVGLAVDRWGSRRVGLPGILVTILSICAFGLATGSHAQWLAIWVIYAFISITVKTTVWTAPIARTFSAARGLALGITLCGAAASQVILPPLTNWLIDTQGWRMAYVWLAVGWGGMTFLLCWLFLYDVHDRLPASEQAAARHEAPVLPGLTIDAAWRDRGLWRISVSTLLIMLFTLGLTVHQIAILGEAGVSRTNAAWLASMAGVAGVLGKLATGALLDRFRPNWVGGITMAATALAFALMIDGIQSPTLIFFAMLVNGYTLGTKLQVTSFLTARYAGMRHFGAIFGFMVSIISIGGALGPLFAGMSYDNLGGYEPFLIAGTVGCVLSGLLLISLPPLPNWDEQGEKVR